MPGQAADAICIHACAEARWVSMRTVDLLLLQYCQGSDGENNAMRLIKHNDAKQMSLRCLQCAKHVKHGIVITVWLEWAHANV